MNETKQVAIVDDHTLFRKGLAALIGSFPDYRVTIEAGNGEDFIAQLKNNSLPDVVLLDISMPGMDGFATCQWIKDHYPEMKVLALSTMDADTAIIRMIRSGAKGYILKDADLAELKRAFSDLFSMGFFYNDLVSRKIMKSAREVADEQSALLRLNQNELTFLKLACSEKTYQEIAAEMYKSEKTIDGYRADVFSKLNVGSRVGMVMYAIKNNLVQL